MTTKARGARGEGRGARGDGVSAYPALTPLAAAPPPHRSGAAVDVHRRRLLGRVVARGYLGEVILGHGLLGVGGVD